MALINQGIIPPNEPKKKTNPNRLVSLRNGIILAALGIGILVGFLCSQYLVIGEENKFWIMSASIVFFLGVGYLVYFLVTRNMPRESQIEQPRE
jgi:sterol desaturase/sphingolipid hydroxylase (fatty acid hydroxylase superfamily)